MSLDFEELDYRRTHLGELILRRRRDPLFGNREVHDIKLNDEWLMSSLFTVGETALADIGLAGFASGDDGTALDVLVGGLGLGYTAAAALRSDRLGSLLVVDTLAEVIEWHERGLVPLGPTLTGDTRCRLLQADFFEGVRERGFVSGRNDERYHAILLDIDHSPGHWLNPANAEFYEPGGLRDLSRLLHPGGVFAMWSNDEPDSAFTAKLAHAFASVLAHPVTFDNPYTGGDAHCTIYVANRA